MRKRSILIELNNRRFSWARYQTFNTKILAQFKYVKSIKFHWGNTKDLFCWKTTDDEPFEKRKISLKNVCERIKIRKRRLIFTIFCLIEGRRCAGSDNEHARLNERWNDATNSKGIKKSFSSTWLIYFFTSELHNVHKLYELRHTTFPRQCQKICILNSHYSQIIPVEGPSNFFLHFALLYNTQVAKNFRLILKTTFLHIAVNLQLLIQIKLG